MANSPGSVFLGGNFNYQVIQAVTFLGWLNDLFKRLLVTNPTFGDKKVTAAESPGNGLAPGGLGPGGWDSRDTLPTNNPFHFRGSFRNPNHQTPQTNKPNH